MLLGLHDLLPVDVLRVAEVVVLQDGDTAQPDLGEGLEAQRLQGSLHDVESTEVLRQVAAADDVEVPEGGEVGEPRVVGLDVDEAGDLGECAEDLKSVGVHGGVTRTEGEILVDLLEAIEAGVNDGEAALQDGAVFEALDVPGMDGVGELAVLGTRPVTGDTLSVNSLEWDQITIKKYHHSAVVFSGLFEYTNILSRRSRVYNQSLYGMTIIFL